MARKLGCAVVATRFVSPSYSLSVPLASIAGTFVGVDSAKRSKTQYFWILDYITDDITVDD